MANYKTQKEAFNHFKVKKGTWSRGPWSSLSEDGKILVLTIWTDQKEYLKEEKKYFTSTFECCNELWKDDNNNLKRIEHITYCIENLESMFRVVFVTPKDKGVFNASRYAINWNAFDKAWFKITDFDKLTGEFKSESI
tara:strand:+ start:3419 stop:3832 length:414 start_codon:yes stop_codon:yes gene_type:complete